MTFGNRLKNLLIDQNIKQKELAKQISVSAQVLSAYANDKHSPDPETLKKIAKALDVSVDYLIGASPYKNAQELIANQTIQVSGLHNIPVLGQISCGTPLLSEENILEYRAVNPKQTDIMDTFFLIAKGDSMFPTITNGDYILIKRQNFLDVGEIGAFIVNDENEITLKHFFRDTNLGLIILKADNSKYDDLIFNEKNTTNLKIIGKAIKLEKNL